MSLLWRAIMIFNLSLAGWNLHSGPTAIRTKLSCAHARLLSRVWLSVTPGTAPHQAPRSTVFSRQESWSGLPFPTPGDLPDPGIEPKSPVSPALAGIFFTTAPPATPPKSSTYNIKDLMIVKIVHRLAWLCTFQTCSSSSTAFGVGPFCFTMSGEEAW